MADKAIRFVHVTKKYRLRLGRDRLTKAFMSIFRQREVAKEICALKDVRFEVEKGEALGIVGPNGAGKTTTLKLISRITHPTLGNIEINGTISGLIEVGAGFNVDLTGRENVYLNGSILGLKKKAIREKFDSIVQFAEVEKFIDMPVKRYSLGMYLRLGFAVAAHVEPEILLIDEILAVGDASFQSKCLRRIKKLKDQGTTIVFVSHNLQLVRRLCDQCLLLNEGKLIIDGKSEEVMHKYYSEIITKDNLDLVNKEKALPCNIERHKETQVEITEVRFIDEAGVEGETFKSGEKMTIQINYFAKQRIEEPTFSAAFYTIDGTLYYGQHTKEDGLHIDYIKDAGTVEIKFENLYLVPGVFEVSIGIWDKDVVSPYLWQQRAYKLKILEGVKIGGLVYIPHTWKITKK